MARALARPLAFVSTATLALLACDNSELSMLNPRIMVEPEAIDFGDGIVDQDNVSPLLVRNRGPGVLRIERAVIEPATDIFRVGAVPESLNANQETMVDVIFVPSMPKEMYAADLVIYSNDPMEPELRVPLQGVGGIREIEVFPEEIDFGVVNEGTAPRMSIEVRNIGGDPLDISEIVWTSTSADMGLAEGTFTAGIIAPMTSTVVEVVYSPIDLGPDSGIVTIRSNDEDEPMVEVPVRGRANLAPRAIAFICDKVIDQLGCAPEERVKSLSAGFGRFIGLDGTESFDPEGAPIVRFSWERVEYPDGSNALPFVSTEDREQNLGATGEVTIDRVGRYRLRLVATDDRGLRSLPNDDSDVLVLPKDLEVLLRWDLNTDVDLHLVRPGGSVGDYGSGRAGTSTGSDCSTFNREPNWGDPMLAQDNPKLDKDEVSGRGPERISIDLPETVEPYTVWAHYCDSRGVGVNVHATVEIWVRGELIQTIPEMDGVRLDPSQAWEAARITWDAQAETAMIEPLVPSPVAMPELCLSP